MAKSTFGLYTLCFVSILYFHFAITSKHSVCPSNCNCLQNAVDCSKRVLKRVPLELPYWTADLELQNNQINHIDKKDFELLNLTKLNLNHNRLQTVAIDALDNQENLVDLRLARNRFKKFPKEIFRNLKKLKFLDLNKNGCKQIEGLTFKGLVSLETLKLQENEINDLQDGAFYKLKNLLTLKLDKNQISGVTKGWLYELSSLKYLSLTHNQVESIEHSGWEFCSELIELDLSFNKLRTIEKGMFDHLPKLEKLVLNYNLISSIAEGSFNGTPSLQVLELNKNHISWTIEDMTGAFLSLDKLYRLSLEGNNIRSINSKAFTGLAILQHLDLSNNTINTIQENAFSGLPYLFTLYIDSESLLCDCNLKWFPSYIISKGLTAEVKAKCAHPQCTQGVVVHNVPLGNFTCDDSPKPQITERPEQRMALKGKDITLVCQAISTSTAPMSFRWKKDNVFLSNSAVVNYTAEWDGKYSKLKSELVLSNISHNEAGRYQCIVSNQYGTTYSEKAKITVLRFPKFTKTPGNMTLKSGSTAKLECAAEGEPRPQIAWQKDGGNDFPAARERRMHVIPADVMFFIINVKPADMGVYSCTAENVAGKVVTNATLTVLETPTFVKPMENKEITVGDSTVLECVAAGSPKPTLTWTKDGAPLIATPRHFFTAENQLLIIVNTALSDAGNYQCEMSNTLGTERGSSRLTILPPSGGSVVSESITGYIIISVVCCAVLTSICWVIIIYQTRKRPPNFTPTPISSPEFAMAAVPAAVREPPQPHITLLPFSMQSSSQLYQEDNNSEHSSDKDSGTGDSAKRSSDDLNPTEEEHHNLLVKASCLDGRTYSVFKVVDDQGLEDEVEVVRTLNTFHPQPTNHERSAIIHGAKSPPVYEP